jgi:hypothetical protein
MRFTPLPKVECACMRICCRDLNLGGCVASQLIIVVQWLVPPKWPKLKFGNGIAYKSVLLLSEKELVRPDWMPLLPLYMRVHSIRLLRELVTVLFLLSMAWLLIFPSCFLELFVSSCTFFIYLPGNWFILGCDRNVEAQEWNEILHYNFFRRPSGLQRSEVNPRETHRILRK